MVLAAILGFFSLTAVFSPVRDDEPIFADPAKSLSSGRGLSSPILSDLVPGAENILGWQPPGYFYLLAAPFRLFGATLLVGRSLSVLLVVLTLILLFFLLRRRFGAGVSGIVIAIVAITPWVQQAATTIRPEGAVALLCVLTLASLGAGVSVNVQAAVSGAWAGLALLMHPLGAIAGVVGVINLTRRRQWVGTLILLAIAAVIVICLWLPLLLAHWHIIIEQWALQGERKGGVNPLSLLTSFRRLPGYAPLLLASLFIALLARRRLGSIFPPEWEFLTVATLAAAFGGEEQYPVYIALAGAPVMALGLRTALDMGVTRWVGWATAVTAAIAIAPTIWFVVAGGAGRGDVSSANAATPTVSVFLGPGAGGVYFLRDPREVRVFSPTPVPTGSTASVARRQGTVVTDPQRSADSEIAEFAHCPTTSREGSLVVIDLTKC